MSAEASKGAGNAHETEQDVARVSTGLFSTVVAVCTGIRDAYYARIDELERTVCAL